MEEELASFTVNPRVSRLADAAGWDALVELEGFAGPSRDDVVRLYVDLSLAEYVEVQKKEVVHAEEISDGQHGRVKIWVRARAPVREVLVNHASARTHGVQQQRRRNDGCCNAQQCQDIRSAALRFLDMAAEAARQGDQEQARRHCGAVFAMQKYYYEHGCADHLGLNSFPMNTLCDPSFPVSGFPIPGGPRPDLPDAPTDPVTRT
jgi:hypothetical protein